MRSFLHVVGARPNFVKAAPVMRALGTAGATQRLCHTGQHHDAALSTAIERDVELPAPDLHLGVGSGTHAEQVGRTAMGVEQACLRWRPDAVIVYGDVNSTLGAALGAAHAGARVVHVEAGLRCHDRTMPEERNRRLVDHLSDVLFATDEGAAQNLRAEGLADREIHVVGNVMADSLVRALGPAARTGPTSPPFAVATLHRPESLTDAVLPGLVDALARLARQSPLIFPMHPRTRARLGELGLASVLETAGASLLEPLGYAKMVALVASARVVITDSGGLQDECAVLGVPCVTVRARTERPATVICGSNRVAGVEPAAIAEAIAGALAGPPRIRERPPLWDGETAPRIAAVLTSAR